MAEESTPTYQFDWDPEKARTNFADHKVRFQLAVSVFRDALALTVYDEDHSDNDERWVTLGQAENGQHLVVIHSFEPTEGTQARIRIISARTATPREVKDYQESPR